MKEPVIHSHMGDDSVSTQDQFCLVDIIIIHSTNVETVLEDEIFFEYDEGGETFEQLKPIYGFRESNRRIRGSLDEKQRKSENAGKDAID